MTTSSSVDQHTEAYKAVIDFSKVIISISSTILAALISYLIIQNYELSFLNLLSPILLLISIFLSLIGFGNAIPAIKTGNSQKLAVVFTNAGGYCMLFGIGCILTLHVKEKKKVEDILKEIQSTSTVLQDNLSPKNCNSIGFRDNEYVFKYNHDSLNVEVIYSMSENKIISLNHSITHKMALNPISNCENNTKRKSYIPLKVRK